MRSYTSILLTLAMAGCMGACSKNNDKESPNEGTVLKKYISTFADTSMVYHFYDRDAANKLITIRDSTKAGKYTMRLEYGSNGKASRIGLLDPVSGNALYYYELEYNADGRISKRKIRAGTMNMAEDYHTYLYDGMGHMVEDTTYGTVNNRTWYLAFVNKYRYSGNNATEAENYVIVNGALQLDGAVKYEYDNGKNPFKSLEYEYYIRVGSTGLYDIQLMSENNMVRALTGVGNGNFSEFMRFSHQYNASNTAWKSWLNATPQQSKRETKYFFE